MSQVFAMDHLTQGPKVAKTQTANLFSSSLRTLRLSALALISSTEQARFKYAPCPGENDG
jgi:hypothetical protein